MKRHARAFLCISILLTAISGLAENGFDTRKELGAGVGPFRLGMTPEQVNSLLPHPLGSLVNMPVAGEFHSSEVRYFWTYAAQFSSPDAAGSFFESLLPFQDCWKAPGSYVTFLFAQNQLIRISVRFFGDCGVRDQAAKSFADSYHIPVARKNGNVWFQKKMRHTTVEIRLSHELTAVDVFKNKSPQPPANWPAEN